MRQVMRVFSARLMLLSGLNGLAGCPVGLDGTTGRVEHCCERLSRCLMLGVMMRIGSVAALLGALGLVAVLGLITPADAGRGSDNYVVVDKVVDGRGMVKTCGSGASLDHAAAS